MVTFSASPSRSGSYNGQWRPFLKPLRTEGPLEMKDRGSGRDKDAGTVEEQQTTINGNFPYPSSLSSFPIPTRAADVHGWYELAVLLAPLVM